MIEKERAILITVLTPNDDKEKCLESIQELSDLALTARVEVIDKVIQVRHKIDSRHLIGKGKLEEVSKDVKDYKIDTVIFDNELTPLQIKNIEGVIKCKVIGRTELILDIFASRARTKESKLQVEYAQLSYLLPRLTRRWTHLSRIEGGIGFRGPGETQLEVDKRAIKRRLYVIKKQLDKVSTQANTRRKNREKENVVCLVGYTNAGKSTLMNLLSKSEVFVDDALFATLDSTVRKTFISDELSILLVDTVGFIKKLPHHLVASFKSTLDEVKSAKLLIHVTDISDKDPLENIQTVNSVLMDLETLNKPIIHVFNKIDRLSEEDQAINQLKTKYENACFISAADGQGIEDLKDELMTQFELLNKPTDANVTAN